MKTVARLFPLVLIGLLALSGCSAVRAVLSGSPAQDAAAPASAPQFTFYDSWARW